MPEQRRDIAVRNVVVAIGMDYMAYCPEELSWLPPELRSHSADHHDLSKFAGTDVAVIGGGHSTWI